MPNLTLFNGPITRYCVELLDTTITNTTTTTFDGSPVDSAYADYRSTNPPWVVEAVYPGWLPYGEPTKGTEYASWCDLVPDRFIGHLSRRSILAADCDVNTTSPTKYVCKCTSQSAAASRVYTGMMPIGLPVFVSLVVPGIYPGGLPEPVGHWFSHPVQGRCPLGARVGDGGCTWQRAPLSHSLYPSELFAFGWNATPSSVFNVSNGHQPLAQTRQNIGVFERAWRAKGLAPCGA